LSSEASGLPSSSSSSGSAYPLFKSFSWAPGVLDGRPTFRLAGAQLRDTCRRLLSRDRREDDPEADGRGQRNWRCNINARGRPIDDLPRPGCLRTRQPPSRDDEGWDRRRSASPAGRAHRGSPQAVRVTKSRLARSRQRFAVPLHRQDSFPIH
jgi:hypothetical protein